MSRITLKMGETELEIPNRRGEYLTRTVDLFAFTHRMMDAGRAAVLAGDRPLATNLWAVFLHEEGFPDVSPGVANELLERLITELEAVKKKGHLNGFVGTPGRSDSPSSASVLPNTHPG